MARWLVAAALLAPAAVGVVPAIATAAPATLKGTVVGSGLPDAGEGVTGIRAVNAETGAVGGSDYTGGRRDSWRLRVSPGPYALGAAAVPFEGGKLAGRLVAFVAARSGDTEKLKLSLKPKRQRSADARLRPARVADGFGDVSVDHPAIWVKEWDVQSSDPELSVLRKGMADMLITDLFNGFADQGCDAIIVEREHIDAILNEHKLQQLPYFDPATRVRPGRIIRDNASVTGSIAESGGHMTLTATYTDRRKGRSKTVSVQGPAESFFDLEQQLAQKLVEAICADDLPNTYTGTFDGTSVDSEMTRSWTGTITVERLRPPDPNAAQCDAGQIACYVVTGGSVTWQISTTPGAQCNYQSAPKTADLPRGSVSVMVDARGGEAPGYAGSMGIDDSTTGTLQCGNSAGQVTYLPLDCCWATNPGQPWGDFAQDGGFRLQGTRTSRGSGTTVTNNWDLTGQ